MPEQLPSAVTLWQEFRKYLQYEIEIGKPEIASKGYYATQYARHPVEVVNLKVIFKNIAPEEPDWPRIVFIGLGIGVSSTRRPYWIRHAWKVKQPAHDDNHTIIGSYTYRRFFDLTDEEKSYGIALFPGDSATLEVLIPINDIHNYELCIEGSVSLRHFFHYQEKLDIVQD
jgi:hypothetical protein